MRTLLVTLSYIFISSCAAEDASGIYIAATEESAEIVHIVAASDGKLEGQFESVEIDKSDDVESDSQELTGTINGDAISIKVGAPLVNLFSSMTFTGSISRGVMSLSYPGGVAVYKRASQQERQQILARIEQTAGKRKQEDLAERATNSLASLGNYVEKLVHRTDSDIEWFSEQKESLSKLFDEAESLKSRWRVQRAQRESQQNLIATEKAYFEVEKQVWAIDEKVKFRSTSIRNIRIGIEEVLKELEEACPEKGNVQFHKLCSQADTLETEFQKAIAQSRQAFDDLAAYRMKVKL